MTYTVAILQVSKASYDDIKARIEKINNSLPGNQYGHMFLKDGGIDLTHIAIQPDPEEAAGPWEIIEQLRKQEGDSVTILCDNPDGLCAIECNGEWTGYRDLRVEGHTVLNALATASGMYDDFHSREETKK